MSEERVDESILSRTASERRRIKVIFIVAKKLSDII